MHNIRILFVDDDDRLCRLVKRYIENQGFEIVCANSAEAAYPHLRDDTIALVLLDIMLPDKDGMTLAQEIRNLSDIPIIFLTAKADIDDKVSGLEIGADDYITKPFDAKELIVRIQTVLRRTNVSKAQQISKSQAHFSGWCLDLQTHTLSSPEGDQVELTSTEYQLLSNLVSRSNTTIKREEILHILSNRTWSPFDRSVDMAISKLRKKIERDPRKPELIKTVRNKGYCLTSSVSFI